MEQQEVIRFFDRCAPFWDEDMVRNEAVIAAILDNAGIRAFIDMLSNVERVEVLPYHTLGVYKWEELGIPYTLKDVPTPTKEQVAMAEEIL